MVDWLEGLNPAQKEAVTHGEGPLLVLAGPGSGKTRVVTHRVAFLIRELGVAPENILAVTFTNKAAEEMRRRIQDLAGGAQPFASTFHRFCARILRRYADRVGRTSRFSILDQQDRVRLLRRVMNDLELDLVHLPPEAVERRISQLKNDLVSPEQFAERQGSIEDQLVAAAYPAYQKQLIQQNAFDFDDLLTSVADLLRTDADARAHLDRQYQFVLVDEYQDTNLAQYAIARGLSLDHRNLCVTGDPDQSIYSWRGANLSNILHFEDDFPGAHVVRLEQNYRSTAHILATADQLIRHNTRRKHKELVTENPSGRPVTIYCHKDEQAEANAAAERIRQAVDTGSRRYRDFAVMIRMNSLSRPFEAVFRARQIPYQVIGGWSFFERKEIRDMLAYLRLAQNPSDDSAFERIVNTPARGIGATTLERLQAHAGANGRSLSAACAAIDEVAGIRKGQRKALAEFHELLVDLAGVVELDPVAALEFVRERTGYERSFEHLPEEERAERLAILDGMVAQASNFLNDDPTAKLADFLEAVGLASDSDQRDDRSDLVSIITFHAAKGLEFPVVFLVAFERDILPHQRCKDHPEQEEEERRLAFVGITRAKEELTISYVKRRMVQGRGNYQTPSPFLAELPEDSLDRQDRTVAWPSPTASDSDSHEPFYEEPSTQIVHEGSEPSSSDRFRLGMRVRHPQYGEGLILQLEGVGRQRKASIHFPTHGTIRFVLDKSVIEPIAR